jgi:hypothetical protein
MNITANRLCEKPSVRPQGARLSSGSFYKHHGWKLSPSAVNNLARSNRIFTTDIPTTVSRLNQAISHLIKSLDFKEAA